jgi:FixJ family two-component response regulator
VRKAGSVAIIDDDEELRLSLGRLMRAYGIEARLFESADAFLASDQFPFDCVIADVHMPGTDGIAMIERLRHRGDEVPVIIVSALDPDRTRELAMASGAQAFYSKPVDSAALLALIVQLANSRSGSEP